MYIQRSVYKGNALYTEISAAKNILHVEINAENAHSM